jgi:hypothetical protein
VQMCRAGRCTCQIAAMHTASALPPVCLPRSSAQQLDNCEPELTAWLLSQQTDRGQLKVVPQQLAGKGRGLVAARPINAGEQVLAVPDALVLSPCAAAAGEALVHHSMPGLHNRTNQSCTLLILLYRLLSAESVLAPLLPEDTSKLPDWTLLVLFLAEQRHNLDRGLPVSATWQPYLQRLPGHPVGTILDWSAEEVGEEALGWAAAVSSSICISHHHRHKRAGWPVLKGFLVLHHHPNSRRLAWSPHSWQVPVPAATAFGGGAVAHAAGRHPSCCPAVGCCRRRRSS